MDTTTEYEIMLNSELIQYLHPCEAYKYLGVTTTPNGNRMDSRKVLKKVCHSFKLALQSALTHKEVYIALKAFFMSKINTNCHAFT